MSVHKLPNQSLLKLQNLKCSECSYITAYPNALQVHRLKEHAKDEKLDKPYKCGVCSYQTSFRSNLQKHQRVHTGEKPYICACCCMRFSFRSNHKRHEQRCLAVRGITRYPDSLHGGVAPPRYNTQGGFTLSPLKASTSAFSSLNKPPEVCTMDSKQHQVNMALSQFVLPPPDESQRAMFDFYYKAFNTASALPPAPAPTGLTLPHIPVPPMVDYSIPPELRVKVKEEPIDDQPAYENVRRECAVSESVCTKGRSTCSRKQSHPRKTQPEWSNATAVGDGMPLEDIKPDINLLNTTADLSRPSHSQCDNRVKEIKCSRIIPMLKRSPRKEETCRGNHSAVTIKKEASSSPLSDVQRDRSPVRRMGCSTSTSETPSSVADTETTCSLPFTLDAVLGDLSLGNLIDMLVQNGRIYRCHHCKILFEEYATYILHMGCHGSSNPFSCHFCGLVFHEKFGFLTHFMKCVGK